MKDIEIPCAWMLFTFETKTYKARLELDDNGVPFVNVHECSNAGVREYAHKLFEELGLI